MAKKPEVLPSKCHACGRRGHLKKECPSLRCNKKVCLEGRKAEQPRRVPPVARAGKGDTCFSCGELGHVMRGYPNKKGKNTQEKSKFEGEEQKGVPIAHYLGTKASREGQRGYNDGR